jgi:cold shock CspA family protein
LAADLAERLGQPAAAARHLRQLAALTPHDPEIAARAEALEHQDETAQPTPPPDKPLPPELAMLAEAESSTPGPDRVEGVVDRYLPEKGFGFLRYGDGQTLFFHITQCEDDAEDLVPGVRVSFVVGHNPKKGKPQAESVRRID